MNAQNLYLQAHFVRQVNFEKNQKQKVKKTKNCSHLKVKEAMEWKNYLTANPSSIAFFFFFNASQQLKKNVEFFSTINYLLYYPTTNIYTIFCIATAMWRYLSSEDGQLLFDFVFVTIFNVRSLKLQSTMKSLF